MIPVKTNTFKKHNIFGHCIIFLYYIYNHSIFPKRESYWRKNSFFCFECVRFLLNKTLLCSYVLLCFTYLYHDISPEQAAATWKLLTQTFTFGKNFLNNGAVNFYSCSGITSINLKFHKKLKHTINLLPTLKKLYKTFDNFSDQNQSQTIVHFHPAYRSEIKHEIPFRGRNKHGR